MSRLSLVFLVVLPLIGCAVTSDETPETPVDPVLPCGGQGVDRTEDFPPPADGSYQIVTPPLLIPGGTEMLYCYFGTYSGEDAGVTGLQMHSSAGTAMHHAVLKQGSDSDPSDGTLIDCTSGAIQAHQGGVLFEPMNESDDSLFNLPDGLAFKLAEGQRWIADVHYINTTPEPMCINVAFDLELTPETAVDGYVSTFNLDPLHLQIPPDAETTISSECEWPEDINILSLGGHMHFYGERYAIEHVTDDGLESIYRVDEWLPDYRFNPPVIEFGSDGLPVAAGDEFRSHCTWDNRSGETLGYPDEMCTTFGVAWPLEEPLRCEGGIWRSGVEDVPGDGGGGTIGGDGPGVLRGTIRRGPDLVEDGRGELFVAVFEDYPQSEPIGAAMLGFVDLSAPDAELEYVIEGLDVPAAGLTVFALLDDDGTGTRGGPSDGDLLSEVFDLVLEDDTTVLDLELRPRR